MRNLGRRLCLLASLSTVALLVGLAIMPSAPAKGGRHKPNLDVIHAEATTSPRYVFPGVSANFSFEDVTKNKGTATACRSVTDYLLVAEFASRPHEILVASRQVPKLH